jgi:hypothetical protein
MSTTDESTTEHHDTEERIRVLSECGFTSPHHARVMHRATLKGWRLSFVLDLDRPGIAIYHVQGQTDESAVVIADWTQSPELIADGVLAAIRALVPFQPEGSTTSPSPSVPMGPVDALRAMFAGPMFDDARAMLRAERDAAAQGARERARTREQREAALGRMEAGDLVDAVGVQSYGIIAKNGRDEVCFFATSTSEGVPLIAATGQPAITHYTAYKRLVEAIQAAPSRRLSHSRLRGIDPTEAQVENASMRCSSGGE